MDSFFRPSWLNLICSLIHINVISVTNLVSVLHIGLVNLFSLLGLSLINSASLVIKLLKYVRYLAKQEAPHLVNTQIFQVVVSISLGFFLRSG